MRIAVCRPQAAFLRGGVEIFTEELARELCARGHDADVVTIPWQSWPSERLLTNAFSWRMLDLETACEPRADLVIATKFPSYMIRHPNKVTWLVHQYRQAYELFGTAYGQLADTATDRAIRHQIQLMDRESLGESRRLFATSENVARRLLDSTGLEAEVLRHPPQHLRALGEPTFERFVLSVGRLDPIKRVELLVLAALAEPALEIVVAGDGPDRERLEALAAPAGNRVRFLGFVPEQELGELYRRCRAVFYAPLDEDFGMVPFEAFRCAKPVVTTADAGGPLEVVRDGETGIVVPPSPAALAAALRRLLDSEAEARALGSGGRRATASVTWEAAIERLLASEAQ